MSTPTKSAPRRKAAVYTDLRVAAYARMSQDVSGEMLGLQRQLNECTALADRQGWDITRRFDDNDLSAFSGKTRPGFEDLLDAMKRGEIDVLVCWHVDRLYRSMKDLERLIEIAEAQRVQIKAVQGGELDLSSSAGRMVARILGSVSRQESEHKGERQRLANQQRRATGQWNNAGQRPFGYGNGPSVKRGDRKVGIAGKPYEPEAAMLKKAATEVLGGRSMRSVVIEWNRGGVTTTRGSKWTNLVLRRMLSNPLYAALMTHEGKVVGKGTWVPLIEENIHLGLVAFLSDPARKRGSTFETKHQGSGIYRCGSCGGPMYAGYPHRKDRGRAQMTYICKPGPTRGRTKKGQRHVARVGEELDWFIDHLVVDRLEAKARGVRFDDEERVVFDEDDGIDVVNVEARRVALRGILDSLVLQRIRGEIDEAQLAVGTAELKPQLDELDALHSHLVAEEVSTDPIQQILKDGPEGVAENWKKASPNTRGKVINRLMTVTVNTAKRGSRVFDDQYIDIDWKKRSRPSAA